ncbi:MAG: hypothetical protein QGH25_21705, partial [Candidatus Latescibacteria bacterium]|nr:hypothetical protein [Candidatus Latescibacterota bacterium]
MVHKKKILAFAREPGGADTIAPVVARLRREDRVEIDLLAKDFAAARFAAAGLDFEEVPWKAEPALEKQVETILSERCPDALFTGASGRPEDDMTEKYFWKCGADRAVPSLAVLDQWQNYILRFSGTGADERLAY